MSRRTRHNLESLLAIWGIQPFTKNAKNTKNFLENFMKSSIKFENPPSGKHAQEYRGKEGSKGTQRPRRQAPLDRRFSYLNVIK